MKLTIERNDEMTHPILRRLPAVFFPVKDLKRATEWYADLLERPIVPKEHDDGIYIFDLGGTEIILDSNSFGSPSMIMFSTDDIDAAHAFCMKHPHEVVTDVFSDEFISVFNINSHMVCKANRDFDSHKGRPEHARLTRMSHVFVHTDELDPDVNWYESFVATKSRPHAQLGNLPFIPMDRGANLLFDDNRLSGSSLVYDPNTKSSFYTKPTVIVESPDLHAVHNYICEKRAATSDIVENWGSRYFSFVDPDGNSIMVMEASA